MILLSEAIYDKFKNKKLDQSSATNTLIFLVENTEDEELRTDCIKKIKKVGLKEERVFKLLENLLISDSSVLIRKAAFKAIKKNFTEKAITPIRHAINNEEGTLLVDLINFLDEINPFLCRISLMNKISKLDKNYLKYYLNEINIYKLSFEDLKNVIFNYVLKKASDTLYFHWRKIPLAIDPYYND